MSKKMYAGLGFCLLTLLVSRSGELSSEGQQNSSSDLPDNGSMVEGPDSGQQDDSGADVGPTPGGDPINNEAEGYWGPTTPVTQPGITDSEDTGSDPTSRYGGYADPDNYDDGISGGADTDGSSTDGAQQQDPGTDVGPTPGGDPITNETEGYW